MCEYDLAQLNLELVRKLEIATNARIRLMEENFDLKQSIARKDEIMTLAATTLQEVNQSMTFLANEVDELRTAVLIYEVILGKR